MNVGELIARLEDLDEDAEVRLAFQPNYPLAFTIGDVREVATTEEVECPMCGGDGQTDGRTCPECAGGGAVEKETGPAIAWIGEGGHPSDSPYLPAYAAGELGWR